MARKLARHARERDVSMDLLGPAPAFVHGYAATTSGRLFSARQISSRYWTGFRSNQAGRSISTPESALSRPGTFWNRMLKAAQLRHSIGTPACRGRGRQEGGTSYSGCRGMDVRTGSESRLIALGLAACGRETPAIPALKSLLRCPGLRARARSRKKHSAQRRQSPTGTQPGSVRRVESVRHSSWP